MAILRKTPDKRFGIIRGNLITTYPFNNMNRDEFGKPKAAEFSGFIHVYLSSQSIKHAARCSDLMLDLLGDIATRSRRFPKVVYQRLIELGWDEYCAAVAAVLTSGSEYKDPEKGKTIDVSKLTTKSLRYLNEKEVNEYINALNAIYEKCGKDPKKFKNTKLAEVKKACESIIAPMTIDQALFGRMVADKNEPFAHKIEAALAVAPSIQTNVSIINSDYIGVVDDIPGDDDGSAFIGDAPFTAGVYYTYVCLDLDQLYENLEGHENREELVKEIASVFMLLFAYTQPSGKRNSFLADSVPNVMHATYHKIKSDSTCAGAFAEPFSRNALNETVNRYVKRSDEIMDQYTLLQPLASVWLASNDSWPVPKNAAVVRNDREFIETIRSWFE